MLISPYICPPVLLIYNQSYSRRVKKFCISSDVHPLGHSPKLHCIYSMKELIACLKTVHANIHIYYAQKLFSQKKSTLEFVPFLNSLLEGGRSFSRIWCWLWRAVGSDMKGFWLSTQLPTLPFILLNFFNSCNSIFLSLDSYNSRIILYSCLIWWLIFVWRAFDFSTVQLFRPP